jgi:3-isopropylmalate dehydrogenase
MTANRKLLMLPGDYIGPEVTAQVRRIIDWMEKNRAVGFDVDEDYFGGAAVDVYGTPLADETLERAREVDAVLLGAVGGPKYDGLPRDKRPEAGLLRLRKEMDLFANLRPAITFDALLGASSLKPEVVKGLDIMIVRELTSGIYFGEPRGIEGEEGSRMAVDTQRYYETEIVRVAEVAFELARERSGRLHSVEKENVMATGILWRDVVTKMHQERYSDIELSHLYVDNCAMQLVRDPTQFDVIVTDNMFGDILSDCASMVTGSLGMLPSASLGAPDETGKRLAVYEPVHGSAPDIAGKNMANPLAAILSFAMMLRYSLDLPEEGLLIENAIAAVLDGGMRTADIMEEGAARVSTDVMGDALLQELDKHANA